MPIPEYLKKYKRTKTMLSIKSRLRKLTFILILIREKYVNESKTNLKMLRIQFSYFFFFYLTWSTGGDLIHAFRGATRDYLLAELDRRKGELRTQLVWIGAQKEPGITSRLWKWVNGRHDYYIFYCYF